MLKSKYLNFPPKFQTSFSLEYIVFNFPYSTFDIKSIHLCDKNNLSVNFSKLSEIIENKVKNLSFCTRRAKKNKDKFVILSKNKSRKRLSSKITSIPIVNVYTIAKG